MKNSPLYSQFIRIAQKNTRYSQDEFKEASYRETTINFLLDLSNDFTVELQSKAITGKTIISSSDIKSVNPEKDALATFDNLAAAIKKTIQHEAIDKNNFADKFYKSITYTSSKGFWTLHGCLRCNENGYKDCQRCSKRGRHYCNVCNGSKKLTCHANCSSGRQRCYSCHGSGSKSEQVAVNRSVTRYNNGQPYSEVITDYEWRTTRCGSCIGGYVTCGTCFGAGKISCNVCDVHGEVICSECNGSGSVACSPCEASGKIGRHYIAVATTKPKLTYEYVDNISNDISFLKFKTAANILEAAVSVELLKVIDQSNEKFQSVAIKYSGNFPVNVSIIDFRHQKYNIAEFGICHVLHGVSHVIEEALTSDITALKTQIDQSFAKVSKQAPNRKNDARAALAFVYLSEANNKIISNATLTDISLSDKYKKECKESVIKAEKILSKKSIQKALLRSCVLLVTTFSLTYVLSNLLWAFSSLIIVLLLFVLFSKFKLRRILVNNGTPKIIADSITNDKHGISAARYSAVLVFFSAVGGAFAFTYAPFNSPVQSNLPKNLVSISRPSLEIYRFLGAFIRERPNWEEKSMHDYYKSGNLKSSFEIAERLAKSGNPEAFGFYSWLLFTEEKFSKNLTFEQRKNKAYEWALVAIKIGDDFGLATRAAIIAVQPNPRWAGNFPGDMLERIAKKGYPGAMFRFAELVDRFAKNKADREKALYWYKKAAEMNYQPAINKLILLKQHTSSRKF